MKSHKIKALLAALTLAAGLPLQAQADAYTVYVGYADNLRPNPNFPSPFADADIFIGDTSTAIDSGAVRIQNTGTAAMVLNDLKVTLNPSAGPVVFHLWNFGTGLTLLPGQNAVFADTDPNSDNFDTSDYGVLAGVGNYVPNNDNCSVGLSATTALCTANAPIVSFTINGVKHNYHDTGHVLDTGGFDLAAANPCPTAGQPAGNCNESLQWRPIGTTGIQTTSFGGKETGMKLTAVLCQNMTTGQKVTIAKVTTQTKWDCAAAGLKIKANDVIKETVTGKAN